MAASFTASFRDAARSLETLMGDRASLQALDMIADCLHSAFRGGHKALVCGNGGSLADAVHFAEEWTGRFRDDRRPYPVLALAEPAHLTCVANDFGFEHVFARGVQAFGQPGDVLFLLSTSGQSQNLVLAALEARKSGVKTIGLLGRDGGTLKPLCDIFVLAPGSTSDRIQEIHMLILHTLIEIVEERLSA